MLYFICTKIVKPNSKKEKKRPPTSVFKLLSGSPQGAAKSSQFLEINKTTNPLFSQESVLD